MNKKTLIIFAHPYMSNSRVNKALITAANNEENVTVHSLCEHYPDFNIDVEAEQKLILEHDNIILQFPTFWFNTPAILKHWLDTVLVTNFVTSNTKELNKKTVKIVTTTGSSTEQYIPSIWLEKNAGKTLADSPNIVKENLAKKHDREIFHAFFSAIEQLVHYTGMQWKNPFVINAAQPENATPQAITNEELAKRVAEYVDFIKDLNKA